MNAAMNCETNIIIPWSVALHSILCQRCSVRRWYKSGHHVGLKIQPLNTADSMVTPVSPTRCKIGTLLFSSENRLLQNMKTSV